MPDPVITSADRDPEAETVLADSVGLALLVVLETLEPSERLAFVLHDVFGMRFDEPLPGARHGAAMQKIEKPYTSYMSG